MDASVNITIYDFVIFTIFFLFIARGAWVGFLHQFSFFLALYVGYYVAGQYHTQLFPFLGAVSDNPKVVFLLSCAMLFVCSYVIIMLFGKGLGGIVKMSFASWFDKVLGAVLGFCKGMIVVVLLHMVLATVLSPGSLVLKECLLCPTLSEIDQVFKSAIKDDDVRRSFEQRTLTEHIDKITGSLPELK